MAGRRTVIQWTPGCRAGRPYPGVGARARAGCRRPDRPGSRGQRCALGLEEQLAYRACLDAIEVGIEAEARPVERYAYRTFMSSDWRVDDVLTICPVRSRHVAGQREARQARD